MVVRIPKGAHKQAGLHLPRLNFTQQATYRFRFTQSCLYYPTNWENDTNKLAGFTLGLLPRDPTSTSDFPNGDFMGWLSPVHFDSVRLAWRPEVVANKEVGTSFEAWQQVPFEQQYILTGNIELWLYLYQQGERTLYLLDKKNVLESWEVKVEVGKALLQVTGTASPFKREHKFKDVSTGLVLHPYFGGNDPAPNDVLFELISE